MKSFGDFLLALLSGLRDFLGTRGGQMTLAFVIYLTSIGMIEKGPRDIGEKIAFMAIGSVLQSMVTSNNKDKE